MKLFLSLVQQDLMLWYSLLDDSRQTRSELDPVVLVLGVLLACCVTVIGVLIFYLHRRKACEHCKGSPCPFNVLGMSSCLGINKCHTVVHSIMPVTKLGKSMSITSPLITDDDGPALGMACLKDIKAWMTRNFLLLNSDKTEVILLGPKHLRNTFSPKIALLDGINSAFTSSTTVRNLCVLIDQDMSFLTPISSIFQGLPFTTCATSQKLGTFCPKAMPEKLVHAFVSSRLDYCNSLLSGCPEQVVKDSTAGPECRCSGAD
ncbi:hypothetical protein L3Q82_020364 [Scortum barcoo]|uniref:Uncharacterized protein n=1 Tax=Scortum barcoo TaxID=214431 RepID=A0ACB8V742_9TELE|nr:hypothetical protein L3Q82_020364 [Scortum barcoo]